MARKISFEGWNESFEKWKEIVKRISAKEPFSTSNGFAGLFVVKSCGYCVFVDDPCAECSLFRRRVCHEDMTIFPSCPFWAFVGEMRGKRYPNFEKALKYAQKILTAIEEDGKDWGYYDKEKAV